MELKKLTKNIYYLPHEPEVDRPMLAYVKGEKYSLAVDSGYSFCHVKDLKEQQKQAQDSHYIDVLKKEDLLYYLESVI